MISTIGVIAALLTTGSFLPQLVKIVRTRRADGISITMYAVFTFGIAMWIVYGVLRRDTVIIAANVVTILLTIPILLVAYAEGKRSAS